MIRRVTSVHGQPMGLRRSYNFQCGFLEFEKNYGRGRSELSACRVVEAESSHVKKA